MAISTDLDGPARRRDHASRAGESGGMRQTRVRRAQRHSRLVRILRFALPAGAFLIAAYYAVTLIAASKIGVEIARTALPKIIPTNLAMQNPRYRGYTKDGGTYVVAAKSAAPDATKQDVIALQSVTGDLTQKDGATMSLTSQNGAFNTAHESVYLHGDVNLKSNRGGWARMATLNYESRTGLITSDDPVEFGNPQAKISGQQLRIMQKTKEITVTGNVVAIITPPTSTKDAETKPAANPIAPTATATPSAPAAQEAGSAAVARMFTSGKGPIEIKSDRLDIDDVKKTAIFIGQVTAKQGDTTMTTPELRIAYDGAPSSGLTGSTNAGDAASDPAADAKKKAAATGGPSAKITSIVAANPVAITQAPATHMTGTNAAFDAATQRATLSGGVVITRAPDTRITGRTAGFDDQAGIAFIDGDVVLVQGADRRATGQHAEFDTKADTALMTGDVVLTQGKNELRGKRLFIDQKAGRSELTAPPMSGAGPGRISAHFVQNAAKSAQKSSTPTATPGGSLMGSFNTDPNAPVDITAAQLEVFEQKHLAVFRGDVDATQGAFNFRTTELNALYSGSAGIGHVAGANRDAAAAERAAQPPARLTRLQARGKVIVTSRNGQKATGDWADFDVAANTVTLGGAVVLTQGRNVVKGTRLVIDMTTGESVINTDNSAEPRVAGERPGSGWRAYQKPSRPSAVFFPRDANATGSGNKPKKAKKSTDTSGWHSTTAPAGGAN